MMALTASALRRPRKGAAGTQRADVDAEAEREFEACALIVVESRKMRVFVWDAASASCTTVMCSVGVLKTSNSLTDSDVVLIGQSEMANLFTRHAGFLNRGGWAAPGHGRHALQICRVTNTSEEIYKNLGLTMPTGKEEDEEVSTACMQVMYAAMHHAIDNGLVTANVLYMTGKHVACRFRSLERKCLTQSLVPWRLG